MGLDILDSNYNLSFLCRSCTAFAMFKDVYKRSGTWHVFLITHQYYRQCFLFLWALKVFGPGFNSLREGLKTAIYPLLGGWVVQEEVKIHKNKKHALKIMGLSRSPLCVVSILMRVRSTILLSFIKSIPSNHHVHHTLHVTLVPSILQTRKNIYFTIAVHLHLFLTPFFLKFTSFYGFFMEKY